MSFHRLLDRMLMVPWKLIIGTLLTIVVLWWLHPPLRMDSGESALYEEAEVVEITFVAAVSEMVPLAGVIEAFEAKSVRDHLEDPSKPIYRVVAGQTASNDATADPTRFLVSVAGGMPPDVIMFDRYAITEWAARGAFQPLDELIEADRASGQYPDYPRADRYYEACWNEAIYEEQVYGIPITVDNRALFYNKSLLIRAGLVYEPEHIAERIQDWQVEQWSDIGLYFEQFTLLGEARPPETWADLEEYTQKLTEWTDEEQTRLKVAGFPPFFGNSELYLYGWLNGGRFMDETRRICTLNEPRIREALEYVMKLYGMQGGYETVAAFQASFIYGNEQDPFIRGQVAMKVDGDWSLGMIAQYARDLQFGIAPPPAPQHVWDAMSPRQRQDRQTVSWTGGWALAMPYNADNKDAAWELMRYIASDEGMRIYQETLRNVSESEGRLFIPRLCPVKELDEVFFNQYVRSNPRLSDQFIDGAWMFHEILPYARYRPITPMGQTLWNAQHNAWEEALYGKDPEEILEINTQAVQAELDLFYAEKRGVAITSWSWFFWLYGLLLIAGAALIYRWDTRQDFREKVAKFVPGVKPGATVAGAGGSYLKRQWKEGWICATPWLIGFVIFSGGPMLFSIVMSLCDYDVINTPYFIGLENYKQMLTEDRLFWPSLWNTVYMVIGVPLGMAVGLGIALLLNGESRGVGFWRTIFYLPAIVPLVAASILFIQVFSPDTGLLNAALRMIGIEGPKWLQDPDWAKSSIIVMGLWSAGGSMIIWLAGLKGIPTSLYEAAAIDGANRWQRFWQVTIPQLTPYIFFNLVMGLIATFQIFAQAFIMTNGGPRNSTMFFVYHLFNNAFRFGKMGYASAMAWLLFVIVLALTIVQLRMSKRWVHYEGAD